MNRSMNVLETGLLKETLAQKVLEVNFLFAKI